MAPLKMSLSTVIKARERVNMDRLGSERTCLRAGMLTRNLRIRDVSNYDLREMYCWDGDAPGALLAALAKSPRRLPCEQQRPSLRSDA
jgi:hypothetical protein